eukprot:6222914-Prymnesium_polylepis.1
MPSTACRKPCARTAPQCASSGAPDRWRTCCRRRLSCRLSRPAAAREEGAPAAEVGGQLRPQ